MTIYLTKYCGITPSLRILYEVSKKLSTKNKSFFSDFIPQKVYRLFGEIAYNRKSQSLFDFFPLSEIHLRGKGEGIFVFHV